MQTDSDQALDAHRDLIDSGPSWLRTFADCASAPTDDADTRVQKRTVVMASAITMTIVTPWTMFYFSIGLARVAAIPAFYVTVSALLLIHAARTKKVQYVLVSQIALFLFLPVLVHIVLGGFVNSSGVVMFASVVPIAVLSFSGMQRAPLWFAGFAVLVILLVPFDSTLASNKPYVEEGVIVAFFAVNIVATALISFLSLDIYVRSRSRLASELRVERERSDRLLLAMLPASIADRLKNGEQPIADRHDQVAVLFADIVDFTPLSETLAAEDLVTGLNTIFSRFDNLVATCGVEKVKTIGDAYMVIAGAPDENADVNALAALALDMRDATKGFAMGDRGRIQMRFGLATGPVIAGVIGESRYSYDVYGDTVNTASRMESTGVADRIQITEGAAQLLDEQFTVVPRGPLDVKGKGTIMTSFLERTEPNS
jgi:adenylate cyclase